MEKQTLTRFAEQGEGLHLEFKLKLPEPEKLMREAIALANTEGGYILIGVDDDGTIVGVKDPEEAEEVFRQAMSKYCRPEFEVSFSRTGITRKRVVVAVRVPPGKKKPHSLAPKPGEKRGTAFYRIADRSVVASKELFFILTNQRKERNVKFQFGEKEKALFEYLEDHPHITLLEFKKLVKVSRYTASRTLVVLVSANVLKIIPGEGEDKYVLPKTDTKNIDNGTKRYHPHSR